LCKKGTKIQNKFAVFTPKKKKKFGAQKYPLNSDIIGKHGPINRFEILNRYAFLVIFYDYPKKSPR